MPQLRVLASSPTAAPSDLLRLFHRAQLQSARAVAEEVVLDGGTWLHNRNLQPLPAANCVLDAAVEPGGDPAITVAAVDALAADNPCRGWTLNPSLPADRTAPLADYLARTGWQPTTLDVLHLSRHHIEERPPTGLTVIPARAAYGPFRQLMGQRFAGDPVSVEAAVLQLDDPHLDGLLALRDGVPVATVGLLSGGDVGTVCGLYVAPGERGRGTGGLMLASALEASARSGHRHVLAGVVPASTGLFAAVGFERVGPWVQYVRSPDARHSESPA